MNNMQRTPGKPYVTVVIKSENRVNENGITHSLEEKGIPFKTAEAHPKLSERASVYDSVDAPLGMIVHISDSTVLIYYDGYDMKKPVLHYNITEAYISETERYLFERMVGNNVANILQGKEIKSL